MPTITDKYNIAISANDANVKRTVSSITQQFQKLERTTNKSVSSMTSLKNAYQQFAVAGLASIALLRKGFQGLSQDQRSINNLNNAILDTGKSAQISGDKLWQYFSDLQRNYGQSADKLGQIASQFIRIGAASNQQVQSLVQASIGLAQRNKISTEQASDAIIKGLMGQTKGLKTLRVQIQKNASSQQIYNKIVSQGVNSFNAIDTDTGARLANRTRQAFSDLTKQITSQFLPIINNSMKFLLNNIDLVKRSIVAIASHNLAKPLISIGSGLVNSFQAAGKVSKQLQSQIRILMSQVNALKISGVKFITPQMSKRALQLRHQIDRTTGTLAKFRAAIFSVNGALLIMMAAIVFGPSLVDMFDSSARAANRLSKQADNAAASLAKQSKEVQLAQKQITELKSGIAIQQALANKTKLTQKQSSQLKTSYQNITGILGIATTATNNYKISTDSLARASSFATQKQRQLQKAISERAKTQANVSALKLSAQMQNLPGSKYTRFRAQATYAKKTGNPNVVRSNVSKLTSGLRQASLSRD